MQLEIITVGDELLIGQVADTNSCWMAKRLNMCGFHVTSKLTVGDDELTLLDTLTQTRRRASVVLLTGGLGPTNDDITLRVLCRYFNCSLTFSEEVYADIERLFVQRGLAMNTLTRAQAMVPDRACRVIRNSVGTAPCFWFEEDGFTLIAMPGVPFEMKWLMTHEILPRLSDIYTDDRVILHWTCGVSDFTESGLALYLSDYEAALPREISLAYLPQLGFVRLRLTVEGAEGATVMMQQAQQQLKELLSDAIFAENDDSLGEVVGAWLRREGLTVGTAESCTGGALAAALTSVPGSSDYYKGSIVAYSNELKSALLGVSEATLRGEGAVSREVVEQMARGALQRLGCDCAMATSGIAGPGGGDAEKPVGTVWIAVAYKEMVVSACSFFRAEREQHICRTVNTALLYLMRSVKKALKETTLV